MTWVQPERYGSMNWSGHLLVLITFGIAALAATCLKLSFIAKKERDAKIHEILDATPVLPALLFFSKLDF
jgi:hypothetical protein